MATRHLISINATVHDLVELQTSADSRIRRALMPFQIKYPTDEFLIYVANLHKMFLLRQDPTGIGIEFVEIDTVRETNKLVDPHLSLENETEKTTRSMNRCLKFLYEEKDHEQTNQEETTETSTSKPNSSKCRSDDNRRERFCGF